MSFTERNIRILIALLFMVFTFGAAQGAGNTFYVSVNGSDSNIGSIAKPFRTVNYGLGRCAAGDTLEIMAGVYYGIVSNFKQSGTTDSWITIRARAGEKAVLDGNGNWTVIQFENRRYILFEGLEIRNAVWSGFNGTNYHHCIIRNCTVHHIGPSSGTAVGIYVSTVPGSGDSSTYNIVQGNTIYDIHGEGIYIGSDADASPPSGTPCNHNQIRQNTIYRCVDGIDVKCSSKDNRIVGNLIYECNGGEYSAGILVYEETVIDSNIIRNGSNHGIAVQGNRNQISRNVIYGNSANGIFISGYQSNWNAYRDSGDDNVLLHNTITENGKWGIYLWGNEKQDCRNTTLHNNIAAFNHEYQLVIESGAKKGLVLDANNWYSTQGYLLRYGTQNYSDLNLFHQESGHDGLSLNVDPQFLDERSHRYSLKRSSPVIDRGIDVGEPYHGRAPDLGAYETMHEFQPIDNPVPVSQEPVFSAKIVLGTMTWRNRDLPILLITSKKVTRTPSPILLLESDGSHTYIELTGSGTGQHFHGILKINSSISEGPARFQLLPNSLVDADGRTTLLISEGSEIYIDKTPPSIPLPAIVRKD